MRKIALLTIFTLLLFGCDNGSVTNNGTTVAADDLEKPVLGSNNNANLLLTIYTMNNVTPEDNQGISAKLSIDDGFYNGEKVFLEYKSVELTEMDSDISDTRLFQGWVELKDFDNVDYWLDIYDSKGTEALALGGMENPFWRDIDGPHGPVGKIENRINEYEYREIIRHWKDNLGGKSYDFTGSVTYEDGSPASNYNIISRLGHYVADNSSYSEYIEDKEFIGSTFTYTMNNINVLPNEHLRKTDFVSFEAEKDFYHSTYADILYKDIDNNNIDIKLSPNREIRFSWMLSDNGVFNSDINYENNILTTLRQWEYVNSSVYNNYYTSLEAEFGEGNLADELQNYLFIHRPNSTVEGVRIWMNSDNEIYMYGSGSVDIAVVENSSFPIDVRNLNYSYNAIVEKGNLYAVKSEIGIYGLIKINDIHVMNQAEMDLYK